MKSILSLLILFVTISFCLSLNCDTVASLPSDFETLLPNYDKLQRLHIQNYFFLENDAKESIRLTAIGKSIIK